IWNLIATCAGVLGDVVAARRAAIRGTLIADEHHATALGLRGRFALADLHLAANEPAAALAYLDELRRVSEACGLFMLHINSIAAESRARLQLGDIDGACRSADRALEIVLRRDVHRDLV